MQTVIRKEHLAAIAVALLLSGCALFGKKEPTMTVRIHEQVTSVLPENRVRIVDIPKAGVRLSIDPYPAISDKDMSGAELVDTTGGLAVKLKFDPHGAVLLDELTTRDRGNYLVVMVNDEPVAAWLVQDRLSKGELLVEGDFTDDQARKIVEFLNSQAKKKK